MRIINVALMASVLAFIATAERAQSRPEARPLEKATNAEGVHGFDFEIGQWRVHHRVKAATGGWTEFDGICRNRALIDGSANVEEHTFVRPAGTSYGVAIRAYDAKTEEWAIWWIDGRAPHGALDPPVKGRFDKNHVGTFYSDGMFNGKPMRTRFIWSRITPMSAQWEQASSFDAGKTWDTNWIMTFARDSTVNPHKEP